MRASFGFTLLELVVVIVILGALAAFAVPQYINIATQARIAAVTAANGAVLTAASLANVKCRLVEGCVANGNGVFIAGPSGVMNAMFYGYPTGITRYAVYGYFGIKDWVQLDGFSVIETGTSVTQFTKDNSPHPANCKVTYQETASLGAPPTVVSTTTGC